jgi:hypothetical protein
MTDIWDKFKSTEDKVVVEVEAEWRSINPILYDAGLAIYPLDEPDFIKKLITENQINPNDRMIKTDKPLLFSAIVENRYETSKILIEAGAEMTYLSMDKDYLFWAIYGNCDLKLIRLIINKAGFEMNTDALFLLIDKCDENTIISIIEGKDLDVIKDTTSLLESAIKHNLYSVAKIILNSNCSKTLERLKEIKYLDDINSMIESPPLEFDFSSNKKRKRAKNVYSKEALIEIKKILIAKNIG